MIRLMLAFLFIFPSSANAYTHLEYTEALNEMRPGEEWNLRGSSYTGLDWIDSTRKPTKKEVEDKILEMKERPKMPSNEEILEAVLEGSLAVEKIKQRIRKAKGLE